MKAAVWPVAGSIDKPMLDRVEVDIVDMARQIVFVSNQVFPIAPLPNTLLSLVNIAGRAKGRGRKTAGESALYEIPSRREIGVVRWERPDGMQVVGKDANGNRPKWARPLYGPVGLPQPIDLAHQQIACPVRERHCEEVRPAGDKHAPIT